MVSCRVEQLRLRMKHRVVTTTKDSVLRTEMSDLEPREEDVPRRDLWFKPMSTYRFDLHTNFYIFSQPCRIGNILTKSVSLRIVLTYTQTITTQFFLFFFRRGSRPSGAQDETETSTGNDETMEEQSETTMDQSQGTFMSCTEECYISENHKNFLP